ncbi:hypothetical protein [Aquimarina algicola]|uniref:Lipoprotein n=1 Tax=Aquimarina algicola TaxID=2589995 RepID=A0A504JA47_9FLAO|nr:hypothetical protein [Aquimarina algicola]TPN84738.1 hypothetical protein FHK87_17575 [Aquimarina algicola]
MDFFKFSSYLLGIFSLTGCIGNMNPNGPAPPNYPYFGTTEPIAIKNIKLPKGTKLTYEKHLFKKGKQEKMMSEEKLSTIELPTGKPIDWGGVPITMIVKFFNREMRGFTVYADFSQLNDDKKTKFSQMWQSCSDDLGIAVKNTDDWSFNTKNILDVQSCSVLYQRYFKDDKNQQSFLDSLYNELQKIDSLSF